MKVVELWRGTRVVGWGGLILAAFIGTSVPDVQAALQLTTGPNSIVDFEWSPDDSTIAFIELTGSARTWIAKVPSLGGPVTVLTSDEPDYSTPRWSADGQYLLTGFKDGGQAKVGALDATTGSHVYEYPSPGRYSPRFGPAGQLSEVVGLRLDSDSTNTIVIMDLLSGIETAVQTRNAFHFNPRWDSTQRGILYTAPGANGFLQLYGVPPPNSKGVPYTDCW